MKISQFFKSRFLRADDMADGEEVEGIIAGVREETMRDGQRKPVLYLNDERALPLNATNARAIAAKLGDEADVWRGHTIIIFKSTTEYPHPDTPCLRVRVPLNRPKVEQVGPLPRKPAENGMDSEIPF
jgi:hypothetical protein